MFSITSTGLAVWTPCLLYLYHFTLMNVEEFFGIWNWFVFLLLFYDTIFFQHTYYGDFDVTSNFNIISISDSSREVIIIVISIIWINTEFILINVYCPPLDCLSFSISEMKFFIQKFINRKVFITGELNSKNRLWNWSRADNHGMELLDLINTVMIDGGNSYHLLTCNSGIQTYHQKIIVEEH